MLRSLIDARTRFLFNILIMSGQNLTKLGVHGVVDKICAGTINRLFLKTATELRLLVDLIIRFLFNF